ncbi:MAG TPA: hypothetical protein VMS12_08770 [Thermoanaerobaculia bacterium]|nr:hypothetical protein [Thermoanaerobaculia bacterium]
MRSDRKALLLVVAVWAISTGLWLNPGITKPDGVGYYVYLPSLRLDGDLLFFNEWDRFGMIDRGVILHKEVTATDHLGNHWTIGSALYWLPSFLFADLLRTIPALALFPPDGVSLPYNVAVGFASAVAGLLTLLMGFRVAREFVPVFPAALATMGLWFGSPLLFYSVRNPILGHATSAFACGLVVLLSVRLRVERAAFCWFATGLAAGFAFAVRPQNGTFLLMPFLIAAGSERPLLQRIGLVLSGFAVAALPQVIVSFVLYGTPYGFLTGGGAAKPFAAFERIWIWEPILSWYHGLIPWSPIIALGLAGLILLWRRDRLLAAAGLYAFASQWFVNATLERSFWGAHAFGQRRFDNCTIFFLLGAAVLLSRWPRAVQVSIVAATSVWTMSIFFAAMGPLDLGAYYTPAELAALQWASLSNVAGYLKPFASVPQAMKGIVALVCLCLCAAWVAAGVLLWRFRKNGVAPIVVFAAVYFLVMSGVLAFAGSTGRSRLIPMQSLIGFNRTISAALGGADARTGLLADEARYLRKAGRIEEAEATEMELAALERARRAGIERLRAMAEEERR